MHREKLDPLKESLFFKQTSRGPVEPQNICKVLILATVFKSVPDFQSFTANKICSYGNVELK